MRRRVPPAELFRLCREATNWKAEEPRLPQQALTTAMPKLCRAKVYRLVRGRPPNSQVVLWRLRPQGDPEDTPGEHGQPALVHRVSGEPAPRLAGQFPPGRDPIPVRAPHVRWPRQACAASNKHRRELSARARMSVRLQPRG